MSHSIFFENLFSDWLASQQSGDTANQRNDFQKMECDTFYPLTEPYFKQATKANNDHISPLSNEIYLRSDLDIVLIMQNTLENYVTTSPDCFNYGLNIMEDSSKSLQLTSGMFIINEFEFVLKDFHSSIFK